MEFTQEILNELLKHRPMLTDEARVDMRSRLPQRRRYEAFGITEEKKKERRSKRIFLFQARVYPT